MLKRLFNRQQPVIEEVVEEPKRKVVDADLLLNRLEMIRSDYARQHTVRNKKTYARGAVETIEEIQELIKGMQIYEI